MGVALDGVPSRAQVPSDLPNPGTFSEQVMNEFVVFAAAPRHHPAGFRHLSPSGQIASRCGDGFPQAVLVSGDAPLDGLGEVLHRWNRSATCTANFGVEWRHA
ncbi:hypothetical protein [Couchioplanes caeruleus]|uniref:Uncharacterized protein n=1 Tax=Couchioplanes caeruleus subsp. caeruleus TaxID=56427 RepID=A0A1K0GTL7_9ACTN|nr:hypothetical protein [Couchioplanes caeruleus]OJF14628.1 hypothetical protein BG844_08715 [Couchioplanes caeruleus subsp. caeruleus]